MKTFQFKKIDAFATALSTGNPAGYIALYGASAITEMEMQQIARELKGYVNEVGFVYQTAADQFHLRFYSSEREVDFCGHATIAIMYDRLKNQHQDETLSSVTIHTNRGELKVENRIETEQAVFIVAPKPFEKTLIPSVDDIASALKINDEEIDYSLPISIINAGLTTLIVPIHTLQATLNISPDLETLKNFCVQSEIDIIEIFTAEVSNPTHQYRTRVFAPTFGYLEDPATGSGNSAFGYYLLKNSLWITETIVIEQNPWSDRYNIVKLQKHLNEQGEYQVLFGGSAITRIEGVYILQ